MFKNHSTNDIRPICIGSSLRRLITKAYNAKLRALLESITKDHQLGIKKGGYEIGVHAARALANECKSSGEALLKLDFENAFNRVDRALLLDLVIALVPEGANVLW